MKIVEEYHEEYLSPIITITEVYYVTGYRLRLVFSNGKSREVDFRPFLKRAKHPSIRKYLDRSRFLQFKLIDGNLNWNDYDLIFPLSDLYEGSIS
jgi:hypothetical protein